ncbi:hypothetical protein B0H16DRAFT_1837621 [Mycena metata]|uniref:Uncharacterized protein n=1 Tax=Mycena metata TaxID=1033252 RepID=A0AAD7DUA3_9AGAR|nr:hypothetical protein B0H16DRAFT_1837621 [Mycena metata]
MSSLPTVKLFDLVLISGRTPGILVSISEGTAVVMVPPGGTGEANTGFVLLSGVSLDKIQTHLLVGDQVQVGSSLGFLVELDDRNEQAIVIEEQTGIILRERRDLVRPLPPLEPPPGVEPASWAWQLLEMQAAARADLHGVVIKTFRGFDGREVVVVGGSGGKWKGREFKDRTGTLIGTAMTVQAQAGRWTDMFRGSIAQVRLHGALNTVEVAIEHLIDARTRYHLTWDMYIPARFKTPTRPSTPIQDGALMQWWPPSDMRDMDRDGTWICEAVRGVRLDVRVDCEDPLLKKPVTNRLKDYHGRIGRIQLKPTHNLSAHKIAVMFDAGANPMAWPENFRPVRTRGAGSIAEFTVRVVIIGPDVNGSEVHIGRYAQVRPEASNGDRVSVVFALDQERVPGQGFLPPAQGVFPVKSLCSISELYSGDSKDFIPVLELP